MPEQTSTQTNENAELKARIRDGLLHDVPVAEGD